MKYRGSYLHLIILPIALPLLVMLSWSQFNWLQELRNRENSRIKSSMINSANILSRSLQEELFFLPTLFRVDPDETGDVYAILQDQYRFWEYYTLDPKMIKKIVLVDDARGKVYELIDGKITGRTHAQRGNRQASPNDAPACDEMRIITPIAFTAHSRLMADFVFDRHVLIESVIPDLARRSLDSTGLYKYRIVDTRTGNVLFTTDADDAGTFGKPDIEVPLIDDINSLETLDRPSIPLSEKAAASRHCAFHGRPAKLPRQGFDHVVLQVANRDGSLEYLSRRTSILNALISGGTFTLLVALIVALTRTSRDAKALAQRQREFIATITHELKTPLAVISSAAENLTDGIVRDQKKAEQYGTMIRKEASRLALSIEHFLLYSKTSSSARLERTVFDARDLVGTTLAFIKEERERALFTVDTEVCDHPVYVQGDRVALESALQNLAQNAIRHAAGGKYLGIRLARGKIAKNGKKSGQKLIIKIRDKGPGIPSDEQKRVFEPFMRGKRARDEQVAGSGIGLNLVKRIIEMHGGSVSLESKPDSGTTFTVVLPEYGGEDNA